MYQICTSDVQLMVKYINIILIDRIPLTNSSTWILCIFFVCLFASWFFCLFFCSFIFMWNEMRIIGTLNRWRRHTIFDVMMFLTELFWNIQRKKKNNIKKGELKWNENSIKLRLSRSTTFSQSIAFRCEQNHFRFERKGNE